MSHPFGDLVNQHLHRRHGFSQTKLAEGILQDPSIISKMCRGQRLGGPQARERILSIIEWLNRQDLLNTMDEADALLIVAGHAPLTAANEPEAALARRLRPIPSVRPPASGQERRPTNLLAPLTSFIGREIEVLALMRLIGEHRLVTLTGAGGVGKTRLALETGIRVVRHTGDAPFVDGVWLIELAALAEPRLIASTLADRFGIPDGASNSAQEALFNHLADKAMLLLFDNCEHLIDGCAEFVNRLLQRCWHLHLLATSRESLRIPGECVYPVAPLSQTPAAISATVPQQRSPAGRLFVERVRSLQPSFEVRPDQEEAVGRICRQLDGMPLALELAAPLIQAMPLDQLSTQLGDQMGLLTNQYRTADPRHRTMHSALAWSYRLLDPAEQRLFARLSVFAGGWTIEAAQAVNDGEPPNSVIACNQGLIRKSLVLVDGDRERRFRMLEPVRQFAREQLQDGGESEAMHRKHAAYFLALAERLEAARDTPAMRVWLQRVQRELGNVRAANQWALETSDVEFVHRLNGVLFAFWCYGNDLTESKIWLTSALALRAPVSTSAALQAEAQVLHTAGHIAQLRSEFEDACNHFRRELTLRKALKEPAGIAAALRGLGFTMFKSDDIAAGRRHTEAGLAVSKETQDPIGTAWALHDLATMDLHAGDVTGAEVQFETCLRQLRALRIPFGAYRALLNLAFAKRQLAKIDEARVFFLEALAMQQDYGFFQRADGLEGLAGIAVGEGDWHRAIRLFAAADSDRTATSLPGWGARQARRNEDVEDLRQRVTQATWRRAWSEGQAMRADEAIRYALETS